MKQDSSNQSWGPDKLFTTEEEWLQFQEDERKKTKPTINPTSTLEKGKPLSKKMALTSLRDLLAEPEEKVDWIVDDLLPKGGLSVIVAKPKTGKSTLARQLALCISRGEEFLSRSTERGLAIYLALEERRGDVRNHFKVMGVTGSEDLKIFADIAPLDVIQQVRDMALKERPALIVVDTLARFARIKDLNDYSQTTSGLEPILALAREVRAHVCLLHHAKKGESKGIDSILGSTGIAGTVDTIIHLHRSEKYRTISSTQRVGKDLDESVLDFDVSRRWSFLGSSREQAEIDRIKFAIIDYLQKQSDPVAEMVIDEGVEGNRAFRKKALRQLVDEQKIERLGAGKKGAPYLYQYSGILVPGIYVEPEYQNPRDEVNSDNPSGYSGSRNLEILDSGSQEKKSVQAVIVTIPNAEVMSPQPDLPEGF